MKELLASIKTTFSSLSRDAQLRPNLMTQEELIVIERRNKRVEDNLSETVGYITQGMLSQEQAMKG